MQTDTSLPLNTIHRGYITDEMESMALGDELTRVVLTQPIAHAVFQRYGNRLTVDSLSHMVVALAQHLSSLIDSLAGCGAGEGEHSSPLRMRPLHVDTPPEPPVKFSGVLDAAFQLIREFNRLTPGRDTRVCPVFPDHDLRTILADRIASEVQELRDAPDEIAWVDAFTDILVVTMDAMCICGEHPSPFFADVMAANFRKRFPDGVMHTDEKGKVIKPEGWVGPEGDIEKHLMAQKLYGYRNELPVVPCVPLSRARLCFVVTGRCRAEQPFYSLNPVEDAPFTDSLTFFHETDAQARLTVLRETAARLVAVPRPPDSERHIILSLYNLPRTVHELSALNVEKCYQWTEPV